MAVFKLHLLLVILLLSLYYIGLQGHEDFEEHHHHSHDFDEEEEHDAEVDHELILGSHKLAEEFHQMDEAQAKEKLEGILKQIDVDSDETISVDELSSWITKSLKKLDLEDAAESFHRTDSNNDEGVTWAEYLKQVYNYEENQMKKLQETKDSEFGEFLKLIEDDQKRFKAADTNSDGTLTEGEFAPFNHPYNYPHMSNLEVERLMHQYDTNGDARISSSEFVRYGTGPEAGDSNEPKDPALVQSLNEQFQSFDLDKDGHLDNEEVREWAVPGVEASAKHEADYLLEETDSDKNGRLTFAEVLSKVNLWVGSRESDDHYHRMEGGVHSHDHSHPHDHEHEHGHNGEL